MVLEFYEIVKAFGDEEQAFTLSNGTKLIPFGTNLLTIELKKVYTVKGIDYRIYASVGWSDYKSAYLKDAAYIFFYTKNVSSSIDFDFYWANVFVIERLVFYPNFEDYLKQPHFNLFLKHLTIGRLISPSSRFKNYCKRELEFLKAKEAILKANVKNI